MNNNMLDEDLEIIRNFNKIDWTIFNYSTVYVTGATGLIGSSVVYSLLNIVENIQIVVQVRNYDKAFNMFANRVKYVTCNLEDNPKYEGSVDYIIHCANPTSSKFFVSNPTETICTAVNGTSNMLKFAKEKYVKGFVFLSTMEVYGIPLKGHKVKEEEGGSFDTSIVRNCYPLSKQTCESLCVAYSSEFNVPTRVIRLTQTFGPGVAYDDSRVFAEFARCVIENKDIVLKTRGETERSYLYIADAVAAIIMVLVKGKNGEIYTAANEATYCSIYDMAKMVADLGNVKVLVDEQDISNFGFANTLYMNLDTSKLQSIGWKAKIGLKEAFEKLIYSMK